MSFFLKSKKLDLSTGGQPIIVMLNEKEAETKGIKPGDMVQFCWRDICIYGEVDVTSTLIEPGYIGIYTDVWNNYKIPNEEVISITLSTSSDAIEIIKKKLKGGVLNFEEMKNIYQDIAEHKLNEIEVAYFAAASTNPGFSREEVYFATKAMAETGHILNFGPLVVDKHSIGGVPSKGITPALVAIIAACDLVIPNTSTRAITSPAGTADILETLMPVALDEKEMQDVVKKTGGCLIWGGALSLAPADDVMINVERAINFESYDKLMISIIAKKIATGVTHLLLDMPVGPGTKVHKIEEVPFLKDEFKRLGKRFGIEVYVLDRIPKGPDGNGIGPVLEARDLLYMLNRRPETPKKLEHITLKMAGLLLELAGKTEKGHGMELAKSKLDSGEAKDKFWEIAFAQGATKKIEPEDLIPAEFRYELTARDGGVMTFIDSTEVVKITRLLGCPMIKSAGLFFHKDIGDELKRGDVILTAYATSQERIKYAEEKMNQIYDTFVHIGVS